MGYRSDVTIVMYPRRRKDLPLLKLFIKENFPDAFEEHDIDIPYSRVRIENGAHTPEESVDKYLLFQFDNVKWYEGYEDVDRYMNTFITWEETFKDEKDGEPIFHYEFMRVGEEWEDVDYQSSDYAHSILRLQRETYVSSGS